MKKYKNVFLTLFLLAAAIVVLVKPSVVTAKKQLTPVKELSKREDLRAFYTAPPVIPHEVTDNRGNKECLYCHNEVLKIENRFSVKTPHPQFTNCQQCHVQRLKPETPVASTWQGLKEPKQGTRAHEVAPPTIPHRIFLRENCNTCHGAKNPNKVMRGPHPERSNCMQCHVKGPRREF